jgi:hypothetical protein
LRALARLLVCALLTQEQLAPARPACPNQSVASWPGTRPATAFFEASGTLLFKKMAGTKPGHDQHYIPQSALIARGHRLCRILRRYSAKLEHCAHEYHRQPEQQRHDKSPCPNPVQALYAGIT